MGHTDPKLDLTFGWLCNISRAFRNLNCWVFFLEFCIKNKTTGGLRPYLSNCFSKFFIICDNWITFLLFWQYQNFSWYKRGMGFFFNTLCDQSFCQLSEGEDYFLLFYLQAVTRKKFSHPDDFRKSLENGILLCE